MGCDLIKTTTTYLGTKKFPTVPNFHYRGVFPLPKTVEAVLSFAGLLLLFNLSEFN